MGKPTDLVQGTLDLLILRTIAAEPLHGWAIAERIRQVSKQVLLVQQGSLYPALQRLERQGFVTAEWGASESNRLGALTTGSPARGDGTSSASSRLAAPVGRDPAGAADHLRCAGSTGCARSRAPGFKDREVDVELDEELQFHLERQGRGP
jgi:hypothetical protein